MYADCKYGHQNRLQKEQRIVICGIKSCRVAEANDDSSSAVETQIEMQSNVPKYYFTKLLFLTSMKLLEHLKKK